MAQTKARLYKYVTPPTFSGGGGITVKIGDKVVTQPEGGVVKNIKAINSLGATTNSIAIMMEDLKGSFGEYMIKNMQMSEEILNLRQENIEKERKIQKDSLEKAKKKEGLEQDKRAEEKQEGAPEKESAMGKRSRAIAAGAFGFFKGLASLFGGIFRSMILYQVLDWFSKDENREKISKLINGIVSIGKWLMDTYGTLINLGLDGLVEFLEDPLSFQGLFGVLKFVTALGLLFAPLAVGKLGLNLVLSMFKKGTLRSGLIGLFKGIGGMIKGLFGFVKGRGMLGALAVGGALFATGALFDDQQGETDKEIDKQVKDKGEEEVIKSLEKQLEGLNAWDKVWGKGAEIEEQIQRLKKGERVSRPTTDKLPEKAQGGKVQMASNGGWITGPQSGYPVSLDGGASTSFIGHGTEWVGRRSSGGDAFVIPFDTPATRGGNGLTQMRMQQAKAGGYGLPAFAKGGQLTSTKNPRRDGSQEENRLAQKDGLPGFAKGGKIFLHWTAGGGNFKQHGKYHSIVQGDGSIYRAHPYDQRSGVAHTYLRNGQGIGLSVAAMAGSAGNYQWPSGKQISSLSGEIADIAKKRGWSASDVNVKNIMTHAEAASGKDGQLPGNDNYGPTAWGGDGSRWDLWHLTKGGEKGSGGHIIRNQVRKMLGMKQIPVPEDAGSPQPAKKAASKGSTKNNATNTNNQSGDKSSDSSSSGSSGFDPTSEYLSVEKMVSFFAGKSGVLSNYMSDANAMPSALPSGTTPQTPMVAPDAGDANDGGGVLPMAVGGKLCPWCKQKKFSSGGVYTPVLNLIAREESGGKWDAMYPSTTLPGATKMTIAEVARKASGAVGKWQNLPRFLNQRARAVGLDPNTALYNEENQTKIAVYLIEKGQAGVTPKMMKDNPSEAMIRLSRVWAAIPVPKDMKGANRYVKKGESYYAGDGANFAHIKVHEMYSAMGGMPKFDKNKKYQTGDVVMKDGEAKIFDGMGWGKYEGGVTQQGTASDTEASVSDTGEEKKDPMEMLKGKKDLLAKYMSDAHGVIGGAPFGFTPSRDEKTEFNRMDYSKITPAPSSRTGDVLSERQKSEDGEAAESKSGGVTVNSTTLPAAGDSGGDDPSLQSTPEVTMSGGAPYTVPANDYARPRFGLSSQIFVTPVFLV